MTTDFERFYYEKVALGESCGCAEQVIAMYDIEARARDAESRRHPARVRSMLRTVIDLIRRRR